MAVDGRVQRKRCAQVLQPAGAETQLVEVAVALRGGCVKGARPRRQDIERARGQGQGEGAQPAGAQPVALVAGQAGRKNVQRFLSHGGYRVEPVLETLVLVAGAQIQVLPARTQQRVAAKKAHAARRAVGQQVCKLLPQGVFQIAEGRTHARPAQLQLVGAAHVVKAFTRSQQAQAGRIALAGGLVERQGGAHAQRAGVVVAGVVGVYAAAHPAGGQHVHQQVAAAKAGARHQGRLDLHPRQIGQQEQLAFECACLHQVTRLGVLQQVRQEFGRYPRLVAHQHLAVAALGHGNRDGAVADVLRGQIGQRHRVAMGLVVALDAPRHHAHLGQGVSPTGPEFGNVHQTRRRECLRAA